MIKLTEFFNNDFVNYASYDNTRKIANYIDGLKSGSRKVAYTILEKNITEPLKVAQLSSKVAEFAEYLHGSLEGVVVTMGQDYCGTNNVPLLQKKGNFGTRFTPEASAARYIFASGSDAFFELFCNEDTPILEHQMFEGMKIEPRFYVPALPVILLNGSEGVSSGFAQKILPRNPEEVKKAVIDCIKGKMPKKLIPWFVDFHGDIEQGETDKQWLIKGTIKRIAQNKIQIDELPIGYDLKGYIKILDDLFDSGVITDYKDLSDSQFCFIVTIPKDKLDKMSEGQLLNDLKLVKKVTENYTCMSEDNSIIEFDSVEDIVQHYVAIKLNYLTKRKLHNIQVLNAGLELINERIRFIELVISSKLKVNNRPVSDIETDLLKHKFSKRDDSWEYLLGMKMWNLTIEHLNKLKEQRDKMQLEYDSYQKLSPEQIWAADLKKVKSI